jgi:2-C-methyl-D-erythritol 2,4-cyclodiphosphate synthase
MAITLGGVEIKHDRGIIAHSDGDVLIHALCDALLGAMALGDIGHHFPDSDEKFKNIDSRELLRDVVSKLDADNYALLNADITIVAQEPRVTPYLAAMKKNLAVDINVQETLINIKATTTEGLGFSGREEGIEVHAVVLLGGKS